MHGTETTLTNFFFFSSIVINCSAISTSEPDAKIEISGFFELLFHPDEKKCEIAYFGILEEYQNKKLGSYLLSEAIKESLHKKSVERVWLHTCSLDHKNALNNYISRGMKIFKKEKVFL